MKHFKEIVCSEYLTKLVRKTLLIMILSIIFLQTPVLTDLNVLFIRLGIVSVFNHRSSLVWVNKKGVIL